jgi:3alpha(or 20beta)-hydroxysteroid dehydrogenase
MNNAGVLSMGPLTHDVSFDDYMKVIEVNQIGVFLGMRNAIPALLRNGSGSIVNTSSTNGMSGYGGTIAYTASKFAVRGMTKNVALEYGKAGIRCNSIHPGAIDTPMIRPEGLGEFTEEDQAEAFGMMPLARVGKPEDVARLALFLASDESSYCTGGEFLIDGGQLSGTVNPYARAELS